MLLSVCHKDFFVLYDSFYIPFSGTNLFHFKQSSRREKRSLGNLQSLFEAHPEVSSHQVQDQSLSRSKRVPVPAPPGVISSIILKLDIAKEFDLEFWNQNVFAIWTSFCQVCCLPLVGATLPEGLSNGKKFPISDFSILKWYFCHFNFCYNRRNNFRWGWSCSRFRATIVFYQHNSIWR